jgi:xylulokinase
VWGGNPAGEMLRWYREQWGCAARHDTDTGGGDWDDFMAAAAESPPGARRVMFLPHMSAAACPVVDQQSLGAFVGLSHRVTAGDVLRAVIEGLDYQFLDMVTSMESVLPGRVADSGGPDAEAGEGGSQLPGRFDRFIAVGGATRNQFWMQNKADVIGRPIEVPDVEEATPLGAAILAGIGVGLYQDEEEAFRRVYKPGRTYRPDADLSARYAEWFQIYKQLYRALRPINHRLNSCESSG